MDPRAVEKAKSRLRVANKALADMRRSETFRDFADNWYVFLTSAKNVYTVLEQGAKTTPQSRQWFGAKATIRRNDPLLQYVFEARNDDEHGLGSSIDITPEMHEIGIADEGFSKLVRLDGGPFHNVVVSGGRAGIVFKGGPPPPGLRATSLDGKPIKSKRTPATTGLVEVTARGGRKHPPPESHLDVPLEDKSPIAVASVMVGYLASLLEEASALA